MACFAGLGLDIFTAYWNLCKNTVFSSPISAAGAQRMQVIGTFSCACKTAIPSHSLLDSRWSVFACISLLLYGCSLECGKENACFPTEMGKLHCKTSAKPGKSGGKREKKG